MADIDGDGYGDLLGINNNTIDYALSNNGLGFHSVSTLVSGHYTPSATWGNMQKNPRMIYDYNDDGKEDLIGYGSYGVFASRSTGSSICC